MVKKLRGTVVGEVQGRPVEAYDLEGSQTRIRVLTLGAILARLERPDRDGAAADVVLGYDDPAEYLANRGNAGALCGRHANRLDGAAFELDGRRYRLPANDGPHHLHGGPLGFGKRIWTAVPDPDRNAVCFEIDSPDGDQGYPGSLQAAVTYELSDSGNLRIEMSARADALTISSTLSTTATGTWRVTGVGAC